MAHAGSAAAACHDDCPTANRNVGTAAPRLACNRDKIGPKAAPAAKTVRRKTVDAAVVSKPTLYEVEVIDGVKKSVVKF